MFKKLKDVDIGKAKKQIDEFTGQLGDAKKHADTLFKLFQ